MDVLNDRLYVLVTGEVKTAMMDPTVKANVIPSNDAGVYLWDENAKTFTVFMVKPKMNVFISLMNIQICQPMAMKFTFLLVTTNIQGHFARSRSG
ncbi:baseplate wedge subunit [Klebsiella phage CPRSB]|nr:baseplate wedge subunit [Klebsiella phage CPRSB]